MLTDSCLNCGQFFSVEQKFCSHCGQKRDTRRFSFRELVYDFTQTIVNTEKGVLRLIKGLALRPGQTAAAYVEGQRKTYFNPFTFYALCIAFKVFVDSFLKPNVSVQDPGTRNSLAFNMDPEKIAGIQHFFNNHLNLVSVMAIPFFSLGLWLFFRKRKRNAAEITVAFVFFAGFCSLFSTVFITPLLSFYRDVDSNNLIVMSSMVPIGLYFAWGLKTFFGYRTGGGYIKVLAVYTLISVVGTILLFLGLITYASMG